MRVDVFQVMRALYFRAQRYKDFPMSQIPSNIDSQLTPPERQWYTHIAERVDQTLMERMWHRLCQDAITSGLQGHALGAARNLLEVPYAMQEEWFELRCVVVQLWIDLQERQSDAATGT